MLLRIFESGNSLGRERPYLRDAKRTTLRPGQEADGRVKKIRGKNRKDGKKVERRRKKSRVENGEKS